MENFHLFFETNQDFFKSVAQFRIVFENFLQTFAFPRVLFSKISKIPGLLPVFFDTLVHLQLSEKMRKKRQEKSKMLRNFCGTKKARK